MQNLLAAVVVLHVQGSPPRHHEHGDRVSATNGHNRSGSYNHSSFIVRAGGREASPGSANNERVRIVVGGSLQSDSPVVNIFKGYNPNGVKFITAAGINPALDAVTIEGFFLEAGVKAQWIPVHSTNCAERTNDPYYVSMVEEADAIYMSGGQSGRLQSCLFGNYDQSGVDRAQTTPFLKALQDKMIVGGSSAGAMNQPTSEIMITGHSAESYTAVREGTVFLREQGNGLIQSEELVDVHFSERGRQGRLVVLAMQTKQRLAFGVDENTAYFWRPGGQEYEVVGENGVVIYEGTVGDAEKQVTTMHFLTQGDTYSPTTGDVTYSSDKEVCAEGPRPSGSNSIFSGTNYRTVSILVAQAGGGTSVDSYHGSPAVQVKFSATDNTVAMCGPSGISFHNLDVEQYSSLATSFNNTEQPALPQDHIWETDV